MRGREAPPPGGTETPTNNPQMSPLRITHDGEFYARLLTKETTSGSLGVNPHSFRYYGPGPGPVPFGWESQPGTPKDAPCCWTLLQAPGAGPAVLPAITPPPSYHLRSTSAAALPPHAHSGRTSRGGRKITSKGGGSKSKCCYCGCGYSKKLKWSVKIGFIAAVFRRIALGKSRVSSAPSVQSSSSTRWLFSGSSSQEVESCVYDHHYDHYEAPATKGVLRLGLGVRQTPWMVQFCGGRREAGWVHGTAGRRPAPSGRCDQVSAVVGPCTCLN